MDFITAQECEKLLLQKVSEQWYTQLHPYIVLVNLVLTGVLITIIIYKLKIKNANNNTD